MGRVVHNPYCEAKSVRVRALVVEESTRSSVKSVMGRSEELITYPERLTRVVDLVCLGTFGESPSPGWVGTE